MLNHPVIVGKVDIEGQIKDQISRVDVEAEKIPRPGDLRPLLISEVGETGDRVALFLAPRIYLRLGMNCQVEVGQFSNIMTYDS